ncbi:MAG: response regulator transcription factor [Caldilineaceae bacterium]
MLNQRILIVEDEPAVARGLQYGLQSEGFDVLLAHSGESGLALVEQQTPHLIVLDIRLPDISGFDLCRRLRGAGKRQPIIMLTARDEEMDKVLGLELGADDYVVKPHSLRELTSRIRALLRRAYGELAPTGNRIFHIGDLTIDLEQMQVQRAGRPVELTPIEFRLLSYLINNPNRPLTRNALIETVWGYNSDINNDRTVDVHIRHLREKLEEDPAQPRRIVTVRGIGYKFQS